MSRMPVSIFRSHTAHPQKAPIALDFFTILYESLVSCLHFLIPCVLVTPKVSDEEEIHEPYETHHQVPVKGKATCTHH